MSAAEMAPRRVVTHSPEETIALGRQLARELVPPVMVLLLGDLGAGKTTLAKGLVAGLGAAPEEEVTSPTFTLIHEYGGEYGPGQPGGCRVYHVDLYRIETPREFSTLGIEDLLSDRAVVLFEWGEKLGPSFRIPRPGSALVEIRLKVVNEDEREIEIQTAGA